MANSGVFHGSRAILSIDGKPVGIFTSCSFGVNYDVQPIYILGRFGPAATEYTGAEPVSVQCSGWRVVDGSPFGGKAGALLPKLQDLLANAGEVTISIYDRRDNSKPIMEVFNCRAQGFSTSISARALQEISVSFIGLTYQDEAGEQNEAGANTLPQ